MKCLRAGLLVGAVIVCASCASLLGIHDPETIGHGGGIGPGASSTSGSASGPGGQGGSGMSGPGGFGGAANQGGNPGSGGGVVCTPFKMLCAGADPPCVDVTSDPQHCGDCDATPCLPSQSCLHGSCSNPSVLTIDYHAQLTQAGSDFVASGLSVPPTGSTLAVGGVLSGASPFGDGPVPKPDPFVWLTDLTLHTDKGFEAVCHALGNCASVTTPQIAGDVAVGAAAKTQLVGSFGVASFDSLTLLGVDTRFPGLGVAVSTETGAQLAVGDTSQVTVAALSSGVPGAIDAGWPLPFMPTGVVDVPVRVARVAGNVLVAGGIGHGNVSLGNGSATVHAAREAFLGLYENTHEPQWFRTFRGSSGAHAAVNGLATDGSNAYLVGTFDGSIDFESSFCGTLTAPPGVTRMFAASLDLSGSPESCNWATAFGSDGDGTGDTPVGIAPLQNGDVAIVGSTTATTASFGGQALAVPAPLFLLILDNGTGSHVYSWTWGNDSAAQATGQPVGVATRGNSDIWIAGWYIGGAITDLGLTMPADVSKTSSYLVHFPVGQLP